MWGGVSVMLHAGDSSLWSSQKMKHFLWKTDSHVHLFHILLPPIKPVHKLYISLDVFLSYLTWNCFIVSTAVVVLRTAAATVGLLFHYRCWNYGNMGYHMLQATRLVFFFPGGYYIKFSHILRSLIVYSTAIFLLHILNWASDVDKIFIL
jgi:hypothetical protein